MHLIDWLSEFFLCSADTLRRMYPGYSLVVSEDHRLASLFALPGIKIHSSNSQEAGTEQVSNVMFAPMPSYDVGEKVAGSLVDNTIVGSYRLTWVIRNSYIYPLDTANWN